jgi:hypothetical protein
MVISPAFEFWLGAALAGFADKFKFDFLIGVISLAYGKLYPAPVAIL